MSDRFERFLAVGARHRRTILAAAAGLLVLSALSLLRLQFDMDILAQLPSRAPALRDYRSTLETFGAHDHLYVVVTGRPSEIPAFADALAERLRRLPEIGSIRDRVDLGDVRQRCLAPRRFELLTDEDYRELAGRLGPGAIEERVAGLRRALALPLSVGARQWIAEDPLGIDEILGRSIERRYGDPLLRPGSERFLSPSGDTLLMIVRPVRSAFDTVFAEALMTAVRSAEAELLTGPFSNRSIRVSHTGGYVHALADRKILQRDMGLYFVLAPLAVLLIFLLGLRTLRILPFIALPLLFSTAVTFALSILVFRRLTMISVAFAGIFYGLGVDSSIYFYGTLRHHIGGRPSVDRRGLASAVAATLREIGPANLVASTTTAAAFFVIGFSDFAGVSQLGIMTGIAMLLNVFGTFVLLPALVLEWGPGSVPPPGRPSRLVESSGRLASAIANHRRSVAAGAALALMAGALGATRLRLDTDFTHLRPNAGEGESTERLLEDRFGRWDAQGIALVTAGDLERGLEAAERVASKLEEYRDEGLVQSYSSLATFLPSRATAAHRLSLFRALPRTEAAAHLRQSLERAGFDSEGFAGFFRDWLQDERPPIGLDEDSPIKPLLEQHLREGDGKVSLVTYFAPSPRVPLSAIATRLRADLEGTPLVVTGRALAESEFSGLLRNELLAFLAAALLLNVLLVFLAERSLLRSMAVLAPTVLAIVVFSGLLGLLGLRIDPVNVIVLPLLVGLGVDGGVYLLAHARQEADLGAGVARGAGPLFLAVATTVAGFGSLAFSEYPALARLGLYAGTGLLLCMLANLVLLPALMKTLEGRS